MECMMDCLKSYNGVSSFVLKDGNKCTCSGSKLTACPVKANSNYQSYKIDDCGSKCAEAKRQHEELCNTTNASATTAGADIARQATAAFGEENQPQVTFTTTNSGCRESYYSNEKCEECLNLTDVCKFRTLWKAQDLNIICTKCGDGTFHVPQYQVASASGGHLTVGSCLEEARINKKGRKWPKVQTFPGAQEYMLKLLERAKEHGPESKPIPNEPLPFSSPAILSAIGAKSGMKQIETANSGNSEPFAMASRPLCIVKPNKVSGYSTYAKVVVWNKTTGVAATSTNQMLYKLNIEYFQEDIKAGSTNIYRCNDVTDEKPRKCDKYTECCAALNGTVEPNFNDDTTPTYQKNCIVDMEIIRAHENTTEWNTTEWRDIISDLETAMEMHRLIL
jgi:hypothetical protein